MPVIVFVITLPLCVLVLSPLVLRLSVASHWNVEAVALVKVKFTEEPEQIVFVDALLITGFGFTVAVTVCVVPTQAPAVPVGVTL